MRKFFWIALCLFVPFLLILGFFKFEEGQLNQCNRHWSERVATLHLNRRLKELEYKDYGQLTLREEPKVIEWQKNIESCINYSEFKNESILEGIPSDPDSIFFDKSILEEKLVEFLEKSDCIDSYCQQSTGCHRTETAIPFFNKVVLCGF